jgi:hypothetical protein
VLLKIQPAYQIQLPPSFLEDLGYYDYEGKLRSWSVLYRNAEKEEDFDFVVDVKIKHLNFSPQHVKELRYHEEETVENGHQPMVDEEGNYMTDTLGNIIQVPKYRTLVCYVTEWTQNRNLTLESTFEILDLRTSQKMVHKTLVDQAVFEHTYATANGHVDILPRAVKQKLNERPIPFPSDIDMIQMTREGVKHQIGKALHQNSQLLISI